MSSLIKDIQSYLAIKRLVITRTSLYNADFYNKNFPYPPSPCKQRQIFSKISKYVALILVEMHKFATNQDYYKKFL